MTIAPFVFVAVGLLLGRLLAPRPHPREVVTLYQPGALLRLRGGR
jgi:hypothetical protein